MPVRESSQNFVFSFFIYQGHGVAESHLADFLARNLFWLSTQPASTYSLNSNNHIQIRFAVKQHPISFRNRKNENMYREAFILIHSNRMWGYRGSWKHMVQKVNICWEPLLLRSDCRNCIFLNKDLSIPTGNDYLFQFTQKFDFGLTASTYLFWVQPLNLPTPAPSNIWKKKKVTTSIILIQNVLPRSEFHTASSL